MRLQPTYRLPGRQPPVHRTLPPVRSGNIVRRLAVSILVLGCLAVPALAQDAATADQATDPDSSGLPADPLLVVAGNTDTWTVSRTQAGCYLLSPRRRSSASLAIGWRSKQLLGLFMVSFALAVPEGNPGERVIIEADGHQLNGSGKMLGARVFFVPLNRNQLEWSLQQLHDAGTLWLKVRHTWISYGGQGLVAALAKYGTLCGNGDIPPG
jgi:hypothetical protein